MKTRTMLLVFIVLLCSTIQAEETFSKANDLYKKGEFKKAFELYQQIPDRNAGINYNLGNCAYKLKKFGQALVYWRRAEKQWGLLNRGELIENISLLKEKVSQEEQKPHSPVVLSLITAKDYLLSLTHSIPLFLLQILFLLLWLIVFFYLRFLYKKRKNFLILALFALTAFFGILLVVRYSFESRMYGVVVRERTPLLSGPAETFQTLQQIPEAKEVIIKKESGDYYKVKVFKRVGWVLKKNVEKI